MSYLDAILLGIVQGLTEFLPVSSSGHLVVLEKYLNYDSGDPEMILFDLALHLGTVVAIVFYYRSSIAKYFAHLLASLGGLGQPLALYDRSSSVRITSLAIIATLVTGIFYVILGDLVEAQFESTPTVAIGWLVTAVLLLVTDRRGHTTGSLRRFTILAAILIGLAQGAALLPGISRSGSTICVAVLLGLRRRWAGEFSFLIGVPAIIGASLIKGAEILGEHQEQLPWGPMLVGALVSAAVGLAALALLIWALRRAKLKFFAAYLALIGLATLLVVYWPQIEG